MPVLDTTPLRVGTQTPTALYVGGEELETGGEEQEAPTPPSFEVAPNHLWWAAGYAGSGPLEDTGTTGGIDLAVHEDAVFEDGVISGGGGGSGGSHTAVHLLVNDSVTPQFGSGEFTVLWVGTATNTETGGQQYFWSNGVAYTNAEADLGQYQTEPPYAYCDDFNGGDVNVEGGSVQMTNALTYIAATRTATEWTIYGPDFSPSSADASEVGSLTGDGLSIGGTNNNGSSNSTKGAAVWVGTALSEAQIEAAALELGYEPPLFEDNFQGTNGDPWNPAKWEYNTDEFSYAHLNADAEIQGNSGHIVHEAESEWNSSAMLRAIMPDISYGTVTGSFQRTDETSPYVYFGRYNAYTHDVPYFNFALDESTVYLSENDGVNYGDVSLGTVPWETTDETKFKFQVLPNIVRLKLWLAVDAEPAEWTISSATAVVVSGPIYLYSANAYVTGACTTVFRNIRVVEES